MNLVYTPLSNTNLKTEIDETVLRASDYAHFCKFSKLLAFDVEGRSAAMFLEYAFGRILAWVHMEVDGALDARIHALWSALSNTEMVLQEPSAGYCLVYPDR